MKIFVILIICLTGLFFNNDAFTDVLSTSKNITLYEDGEYELRAFVKPRYVNIKKKIVLTPSYREMQILKDVGEEKVYSIITESGEAVDLSWVNSNGYDILNIDGFDYQSYTLESNLKDSDVKSVLIFYFDMNNDNKPEKLGYTGDFSLLSNFLNIKKKSFALDREVFIPKTFNKMVLHKFGVYKYKEWHYDTFNYKDNITNGEFFGSFNKGGYIVFQKNYSYIDIFKYPIIGFDYEISSEQDFYISIRFIAKAGKALKKRVVIEVPVEKGIKPYFFDMEKVAESRGLDLKKLKIKEIVVQFTAYQGSKTEIKMKELIFSERYDDKNREIMMLSNATITEGRIDDVVQGQDSAKLLHINLLIKNNTPETRNILFGPLSLYSSEEKQLPKVFIGPFDKTIIQSEIDDIMEGKKIVEPVKLWEIKNISIPIDKSDVLKYKDRFNEVFRKEVGKYFDKKIVLMSDVENYIGNSDLLLKIKGSRNGKSFKELITFQVQDSLKSHIELLYSDVFIDDISLFIGYKTLPFLDDNFYIKINELSINGLEYKGIPEKVPVEDIGVEIFNESDKVSIPIKTYFNNEDFSNGGKWFNAGTYNFNKGDYQINFNDSQYFTINKILLKKGNILIFPESDLQAESAAIEKGMLQTIKRVIKLFVAIIIIGLFVIAILIIRKRRTIDKLGEALDSIMKIKTFFSLTQVFLFILMIFLFKRYLPSGEISWGLIVFLIMYSLWVRYYIRPLLSKKWIFFKEKITAPYFGLSIILLFFTAIILAAKNEKVAEYLAILVYFLLIEGVILELIRFLSRREDFSKDT